MNRHFWGKRMRRSSGLLLAAAAGVCLIPAFGHAQVTFLNSFGSYGRSFGNNNGGLFNQPVGVAVSENGTIYVTDVGNYRVQIFSSPDVYESSIGSDYGNQSDLTGGFAYPDGVAVSASGTVYVTDTSNSRIETFNLSGAYENQFGINSNVANFSPLGVAIGADGDLYVADSGFGFNRVDTFDSSGDYLNSFGSPGAGSGQFNNPNGVAVSGSGNVYVTDQGNNRVQILDSSGDYLSSFGGYGTGSAQFNSPQGVAVSATGNVYVADTGNDRVEVFNSAGAYQNSFGSYGSGSGQFDVPEGVAVTPSGIVCVTDTANNRVERFFNPSEWVSGANTFTDPTVGPTSVTVGPGQMMGASLTLNANMGLDVGSSVTVNSGGFLTQAGGSLSASVLYVSGNYIYQNGSLNVGEIAATGGLFEATTGGQITLSAGLAVAGAGEALLDAGTSLTCGTVSIQGGLLALNDASISDTGNPFHILGGEVQLQNQNLAILNTPQLLNESGLLDGSGRINGQLQNFSGGQVAVASGQSMTITGSGNTNDGIIELTGGTFHFTADLTNEFDGSLEGYGTLRADGGLTNDGVAALGGQSTNLFGSITNTSGASLSLNGSAYVFGNVINNSGALIHLSGSTNVFYGTVLNAGSLQVDSGASGALYGAYSGGGSILNNGTLFVNASSISGAISGNGNLTIGTGSYPSVVLALAQNSGITTVTSLEVGLGSSLDLTNNDMFIEYGSGREPIASIAAWIKSGYAGGAWNGPGIMSTAAQANSGSYGIGYADSADPGNTADLPSGTIEIKYTLLGDANLSGVVDGVDFGIVAANFNKGVSGWDQGDFNYDNVVDGTDFADLAANFNKGASDAAAWQAVAAFAAANGLLADVPEPASASLLAIGSPLLLRRRVRRSTVESAKLET